MQSDLSREPSKEGPNDFGVTFTFVKKWVRSILGGFGKEKPRNKMLMQEDYPLKSAPKHMACCQGAVIDKIG